MRKGVSVMKLKVGQRVRFHPIIGGKHDGGTYVVKGLGLHYGKPVVFLEGKADGVDPRSLTPYIPVGPRK